MLEHNTKRRHRLGSVMYVGEGGGGEAGRGGGFLTWVKLGREIFYAEVEIGPANTSQCSLHILHINHETAKCC